jgi:hypothetical protein
MLLVLASQGLIASCGPKGPPRPPEQGAHLVFQSAVWELDDSVVEVFPNGEVHNAGALVFRLNGAGHVTDPDGKLMAMLLNDGTLLDAAGDKMGWIGAGPSFDKKMAPRVFLFPGGEVTIADEDGAFQTAGLFSHCQGPMRWTCTTVTHVLSSRELLGTRSRSGGTAGVGDILRLLEVLRVFK